MKKLITLAILMYLIPSICFADVNAAPLNKGDVAPFTGILFTSKMEQQFRLTDEQLTYEKSINLSLTEINEQYKQEVVVMQERITNQQSEIKDLASKSDSFFGRTGFFILGCVVTGLVSYGVYKSSR